jgi:GT2 family glycosyltransferase
MNKTAIIVVSHNGKEITDPLCRNIETYTKSPYDLFVVETGSRLEKMSSYATLWVKDGIRMTRGFNWGIKYAIWKEKMEGNFHYDSFWLLVNDAKLFPSDTLTSMLTFMRNTPDCGQIHPFIDNSCSQVLRKSGSSVRKISFVEIVCPLLSRRAVEIPDLLDEQLFYGWGLDYEMPHILYQHGLRAYISDDVGVTHDAGTTVKSGNDAQISSVTNQFDVSRANMVAVMTKKYGPKWGQHLLDSVPADVPKESLLVWLRDIGQNL